MAKVILTQELTGVGAPGDVIEVKNGYARNYLVPKGFAVHWTRGGEKQVEQIKAARAARELATHEEAVALKASLEGALIKIAIKAGAEGRLFGSVRSQDVADAVEAQGIGKVDKRKVEFPNPIKTIGTHEATIRLREDISATVKLQIVNAR